MNHGTQSSYTNRKCRCVPCRAANARAQRDRREVRAKLIRANPEAYTHGTESTYNNWGCRCQSCIDAHAAVKRAARRGGS